MEKVKANEWVENLKKLYVEADYKSVEKKLRQNKSAYADGVYYYNIGTLHIKKGEIGLGRYGLEKALSHGFQSPQVFHNLDLVREKIQVEDISSSSLFNYGGIERLKMFSFENYLSLTLGCLIFLVWLMRFKFLESKLRRLFLILLVCIPILFKTFYLNTLKFAVVLKKSQAYEGPSKIYSKVFDLEEGSKVLLSQKSGKWYLIASPPQMRGWVQEQVIGKL
ncbi:MAG: hypothetical protein CME68_02395 [Halobacteriovoraceae bacterium]|nr:hypothetical protein [Halobacteriovoraceae bacterium]|tara:strand:+ start:797 stop:1462 length:666 start_codon:yes stop_codon:yes gene_type:complete